MGGRWSASPKWGTVLFSACVLFLLQVTNAFELYVCYSPLGTKAGAINAVNKLMKWIRKEEDRLFILTPQTY